MDVGSIIFIVSEHLKIMKNNKDSLYTIDKAIEDLDRAVEMMKPIYEKYDYRKLPRKD